MAPEKGRAHVAHIGIVVNPIQDIERIEGKGKNRAVVLLLRENAEVPGPTQIDGSRAWPLQAVPGHAGRTGVGETSSVIVVSRGETVGLPRRRRHDYSKLEHLARFQG